MVAPYFLNVDLDIESKSELAVLKAELGRNVVDLGPGPVKPGSFLLRLEIVRLYKTPDATICAFCKLLEGLSPKAKRAWQSAHKKEFDVGHDVVQGQLASQFSLRTETLKRLSGLGATLGITFYSVAKRKSRFEAAPLKGRKS
jgi:transposase-like protein